MKRIITLFFGFVFLVALNSSCDELSDGCAECCLVTYVDGVEVSSENCVEYCDDELADIENEPPVTVGNKTTQYECY